MKTRLVAFTAVLVGIGGLSGVQAQQLVVNGDFETLELDEVEQPLRDVFGNASPADWYRSINAPPAVPYTELIGPENGDPATDSNGSGSYAAAINTGDLSGHADWRSAPFATTPAEEISWSFDFKIADYFDTNPSDSHNTPEGFRAELRSHESFDPETGNTINFVGEQPLYVYVHGYGADTNGDGFGDSGGYAVGGSWPHLEANVTVVNFNDGQWHTLNSDIFGDSDPLDDNNLWTIPDNGNGSDFRISVNAFNFVFTSQFQLLVDNVSVIRPGNITPTGDYNGNGTVDAADYTVWRDTFGQSVATAGDGADGDLSGTIDAGDYAFWKTNFGTVIPPGAGSLAPAGAVPEPTCWILALSALALLPRRRSERHRMTQSV